MTSSAASAATSSSSSCPRRPVEPPAPSRPGFAARSWRRSREATRVPVGVSIGIAEWDGEATATELFDVADAALREAKSAGGGRIVGPGPDERGDRLVELTKSLVRRGRETRRPAGRNADRSQPALPAERLIRQRRLGRAGKILPRRISCRTEPRGRIRRRSSARRGFSPLIETPIQSRQLVSIVRSGVGASPGLAEVDPLSIRTCQGSASSKRHWIVIGEPLTASVRALRATMSK